MKTRLIGVILAIALAVTGTVVLTGYVGGADARAAKGTVLVSVYVVAEEIPAGMAAAELADYVMVKKIPAVAVVPGHVTKLSALEGQVSDTALSPGEQLIGSHWVDPATLAGRSAVEIPEGMQAVSLALPVEQVVGGTVQRGDTVGVVITSNPADGNAGTTREVFHKVLVTAVQNGSTTPPAEGSDAAEASVDVVMVTLALATPDVEVLVWGQRFGSVWLTMEPAEADETGSRKADIGVVFP